MAKISFTGDFLCYPSITHDYGPTYDSLWSHAGKLKDCDYLVGNLESPIAGAEMLYTHERYCFNTPEGYAEALRRAGFDMITLANNHCMDRCEEGIFATLANLRGMGFDTLGMYTSKEERDTIFVKEFDGVKVAFIDYTYGTNAFAHQRFLTRPYLVNLFQPEETRKGSVHLLDSNEEIAAHVARIYAGDGNEEYECVRPYLEQLKSDIQRAKEEADFVIMIMHSGGQYNIEIDPYTRHLASLIRSYGADIIVGHHPHIIQPCEWNGDHLTVYSIGNFIDSIKIIGEQEMDSRYNVVLHLDIKRIDGKVVVGKSFSLYKVVEGEDYLYTADTYDLYREAPSEKLREDILFFANRFAGKELYTEVQEVYTL